MKISVWANPLDRGDLETRSPLQCSLHEEVDRLPAKYRIPLILCDFEARTRVEVALLLHCPVTAVRRRVCRARELLFSALIARGLTLPPSFLMSASVRREVFTEQPDAALVERTLRKAMQVRGHRGPSENEVRSGTDFPPVSSNPS
jgi:hypothetical protein